MKCSSRRNCDCASARGPGFGRRLNEVQFPKELRRGVENDPVRRLVASMKCSSQRNCDTTAPSPTSGPTSLNEVQFPKELRLGQPLPQRLSYVPQ